VKENPRTATRGFKSGAFESENPLVFGIAAMYTIKITGLRIYF